MVGALIVIEVLLGMFSTSDGVGHWAHVGGALTGFLLYFVNKKYLKNI
jgi:membrane associated rhomboid family serine protease